MPTSTENVLLYLFIAAIALFLIGILLYHLALFFNKFMITLKYINTEIHRSEGDMKKYWLRRRRKLWLSLIPFVKF